MLHSARETVSSKAPIISCITTLLTLFAGHIVLMKKYYKNMSWSSYDLPIVLEERGVHDAKKLPGFHYRDDAMKLWQAIREYIKDILTIYYNSDEKVQSVSK